jgi:hypothetical protein
MFLEQNEDNINFLKEQEKKKLKLKEKMPTSIKFDFKKSLSKISSINVGGKIFKCNFLTLMKHDSFLRILFSDIQDVQLLKDEDNIIFIDRPWKPFEIILNCIRSNLLEIPEDSELNCSKKLLLNEIKFYGLENTIKFVKKEIENPKLRKDTSTIKIPRINPNINGRGPFVRPPRRGPIFSAGTVKDFFNGVSTTLDYIIISHLLFYSLNLKYFENLRVVFIPLFINIFIELDYLKAGISIFVFFPNDAGLFLQDPISWNRVFIFSVLWFYQRNRLSFTVNQSMLSEIFTFILFKYTSHLSYFSFVFWGVSIFKLATSIQGGWVSMLIFINSMLFSFGFCFPIRNFIEMLVVIYILLEGS